MPNDTPQQPAVTVETCKNCRLPLDLTDVAPLTTVECLASCGTAPMMMVGDAFFENLTPASVDALLTELQETP